MIRTVLKTAALAGAGLSLLAAPAGAQEGAFEDWRAGFERELLNDGVPSSIVREMFEGVEPNPVVIERDRTQPEFVRPVWVYLEGAVSEARIENGRAAQAEHDATLQAIENRCGVSRHVLAAIWGLESAYGVIKGDYDVVASLSTLAWEGRRRGFAESQLRAVADMLERGYARREDLKGSWAGAMGHTQFIPATYMERAVDFDGDGRRNIWTDEADALASAANLLDRAGWRTGEPTVYAVSLPDGFDFSAWRQNEDRPVAEWAGIGLVRADGEPWAAADLNRVAELELPAGAGAPGFLTFSNFDVIKRYNNSTAYALGVSYLAKAFEDAEPLPGGWPENDPPITRSQTRELQAALTAMGYDTRGVDGMVGPNTRRALRRFQAEHGLEPDGYAGAQSYSAVMAAAGE